MLAAESQQLFSGGFLSAVCFGVGLIALLWVFRRTIIIRRRQKRDDVVSKKQRSVDAHKRIEEIDARDWKSKYDRSVKLPRGQAPDAKQRRVLDDIASRQHQREDHE